MCTIKNTKEHIHNKKTKKITSKWQRGGGVDGKPVCRGGNQSCLSVLIPQIIISHCRLFMALILIFSLSRSPSLSRESRLKWRIPQGGGGEVCSGFHLMFANPSCNVAPITCWSFDYAHFFKRTLYCKIQTIPAANPHAWYSWSNIKRIYLITL